MRPLPIWPGISEGNWISTQHTRPRRSRLHITIIIPLQQQLRHTRMPPILPTTLHEGQYEITECFRLYLMKIQHCLLKAATAAIVFRQ